MSDVHFTPLAAGAGYRGAPVAPPSGYNFGSTHLDARNLPLSAHLANERAKRKIGPARLECPTRVTAGERLCVRVHFPKGPEARIAGVEVRLVANEDGTVHRYDLPDVSIARAAHLQIADALPEPGFADGAIDAWSAAFDVPLDAPPSLATRPVSLSWSIEVRCRSKHAPEYLLVAPLVMRPPCVGVQPAA